MALFLVTIKLPRNPEHDPKNKIAAPCPANRNNWCTDSTGEHHTEIVNAIDEKEIPKLYAKGTHITRIESVPAIVQMVF